MLITGTRSTKGTSAHLDEALRQGAVELGDWGTDQPSPEGVVQAGEYSGFRVAWLSRDAVRVERKKCRRGGEAGEDLLSEFHPVRVAAAADELQSSWGKEGGELVEGGGKREREGGIAETNFDMSAGRGDSDSRRKYARAPSPVSAVRAS